MLRSLLVLAFVGGVAAGAGYLARRPTVARGEVIAADLLAQNAAQLRALACDPEIPIGITGATFTCVAEYKTGATKRIEFTLDRAGAIRQIGSVTTAERPIDKSDPWR